MTQGEDVGSLDTVKDNTLRIIEDDFVEPQRLRGTSMTRTTTRETTTRPDVWYDPRSGGRVRYVEFKEDGLYRKYILEERSGTMQWVRWKDPPRALNEKKLVFEKQAEGCFVERFIETEDVEEAQLVDSDDSEEERRRLQTVYLVPRVRKRSSWQSGDTDIHYDPRSNGCIRYERGEDGYYRKFRLQFSRDRAHDWTPVSEQRNLSEVVYQRSPEGFYLEVLLPLPVAACIPSSFEERSRLSQLRSGGGGGGWLDDVHGSLLPHHRAAMGATSFNSSSKCPDEPEPPVTVFVHGPSTKDSTHLTDLIQRTSVFSEAEKVLVGTHHLSPRPYGPSGGRSRTSEGALQECHPNFDESEVPRRRRMTDLTDRLAPLLPPP